MMNTAIAPWIAQAIASVTSLFLFISPMKSNSVQQGFKPNPVVNCAVLFVLWWFFVHRSNVTMVIMNSSGLAIELLYVSVFLVCSHRRQRNSKMIITLVATAAYMATIVAIAVIANYNNKDVAAASGILGVIFNLIMHASPLSTVVRTKTVKYMPVSLSLAAFYHASVRLAYGLLKGDMNVVIPSCLGVFYGLVQLRNLYKSMNHVKDD